MTVPSSVRLTLMALLVSTLSPALAQTLPPPQNVLNLQASASLEVPYDLLTVVMAVTREGPDANTVQQQLKQALDAALTEARKSARPGQVDVRTGQFSLYPRHNSKGAIAGWQGTAELILEGRDIATVAQLSGRLPTLAVQRLGWALSREAREKVEGDAAAEAIARFKARAAEYSRQFGQSGYTLKEVNVMANEPGGGPVPVMMRAKGTMESADAALPVEPGRGTVTVTVAGSVQMSAR